MPKNEMPLEFEKLFHKMAQKTGLRAKYYTIDRSTSDSIRDLLIQMLNRLKKL
jgi:hypothetical protein